MKKTLVALAALAVVSAASAQSSVTLFGVVDATVAWGSGDVSDKTQLTNSGYNSSRLGFRGVEDLGGGLKASFHLEAGVNNDDGTGSATNVNNQAVAAFNPVTGANAPVRAGTQGLTFNRKSVVSILGGFGEFRLGRDYTPQFWNMTVYDPFGTNGVGSTRALSGAGGITTVRASNSLAYLSPSFAGVTVWAQGYLGENASSAASQAGDGGAIRVAFDKGPMSVALAYSKTTTGPSTDIQSANIGGSYKFGVAQVMGMYSKDKNTVAPDVTGYTLGALVAMGPGTIRVALSNNDNGTAKTDQFALGYVYDMSKRTSVYATVATVKNSGGASAALNGSVTTVNGTSNGVDLGVKHSF